MVVTMIMTMVMLVLKVFVLGTFVLFPVMV